MAALSEKEIARMEEYIFDKTLTKRPCVYKKVNNVLYPILYF